MTCGTVFWSSFHLFCIAVNTFLSTANFLTFLHIPFGMVLGLLLFSRKRREYYFSHKVDCINDIGGDHWTYVNVRVNVATLKIHYLLQDIL